MLEQEIQYNGCKYTCYLKEIIRINKDGEKYSQFKTFCRRQDAKCKVPFHLPAVVTPKALPEYVPPKPKIEKYSLPRSFIFREQILATTRSKPFFEFLQQAKERLSSITPSKRGIERGHLRNDLQYLWEDKLITEAQRIEGYKILDKIDLILDKPKPKPKPKVILPTVSKSGKKHSGKLRQLADKMESQIEAKLNPPISQQRTTARRARITTSIREEGERLKKIQMKMYAIADAMEAGTLPPILEGIRSKADVDKLLVRVELRQRHPSGTLPRTAEEWWLRLPRKPDPKDTAAWQSYDERLKEWEKEIKPLLKMGLDNDAKVVMALDALESLGKTVYSEEQQRAKIIQEMEMELLGRKIPGYFPTPPAIAQEMVRIAAISGGMAILEPSAGKGNIAEVIRNEYPKANLEVIEWQQELRNILTAKGFKVIGDDFFQQRQKYDRIIQNPPFEKFQDIDHVKHAYDLLKPGGRLVSIMSIAPFFRSDKKAVAFREWFDDVGGEYQELPDGAFYSSERPTGVKTTLVIIDK